MTKEQALELLRRVKNAFAIGTVDLNKEGTRQEYTESIINLNYKTMDIAIDDLKETSRFTPTIAELLEQYHYQEKNEKAAQYKQVSDKCPCCGNDGMVALSDDQGRDIFYACDYGKCRYGATYPFMQPLSYTVDPNEYVANKIYSGNERVDINKLKSIIAKVGRV